MAIQAFFRGFKFPFGASNTSLPAEATDNDLIKQSLIQIILTQKGERVMRPTFGSKALSFVFENNNDVLSEQIRTDVVNAIATNEPRVITKAVEITQEDNVVIVDVRYVVIATRQDQRLRVTMPGPATATAA